MLKQFNITMRDFRNSKVDNSTLTTTWQKFKEMVSYTIGVDFNITFTLNAYINDSVFISDYNLNEEEAKKLHFEEIHTFSTGFPTQFE